MRRNETQSLNCPGATAMRSELDAMHRVGIAPKSPNSGMESGMVRRWP
jgi:hypothetical protein